MRTLWNKRSRWVQTGFVILLFSFTLTGCTDPMFLFTGEDLPYNFHELDTGKAYRSSQPTGEELKNIIDLFAIKTVINLRGSNPDEVWYNDEVSVCQENGVKLIDHRMSSGSLPEPELLSEIISTLKTAEYPILIHCQGGSDRTSGISAIYRMLIAGDERSEAVKQLSTRYFHFKAYAPCMDYLAEIYEPTDEWLNVYAQNFDQYNCGG